MIFLDLDRFKEVNDSAGHHAGDQVLVQVGERLRSILPDGAMLARLSGDEFAICIEAGEPSVVTPLVQRVQSRIAEPFSVAGRTTFLGVSIGVALAPAHGTDAEELMINADLAMYQAKADRSNVARFFVPRLREEIEERIALESDLRRAFRANEFHLYYQPQVRCRDRVVTGAEALLRWRHPERGVLLPGAFLSGLRDRPLGTAIGNWAIRTACRDAAGLRAIGRPIRVGVNLFPGQFIGGGLVETVVQALGEADLPADFLELEITEEIVLRDDPVILKTVRELREIGVRLAFDDYGTGYASLSMLKRFPVTRLKIDRSFIHDLSSDAGDAAIVAAVIRLGQSFGLNVIAEGIETEKQERLFLGLGGDEAQGFLYGRAVPLGEFRGRANVNRRVI
jgi:diguanylate cyclase (GGDEF)-like protein